MFYIFVFRVGGKRSPHTVGLLVGYAAGGGVTQGNNTTRKMGKPESVFLPFRTTHTFPEDVIKANNNFPMRTHNPRTEKYLKYWCYRCKVFLHLSRGQDDCQLSGTQVSGGRGQVTYLLMFVTILVGARRHIPVILYRISASLSTPAPQFPQY